MAKKPASTEQKTSQAPAKTDTLNGSNTLPAEIAISENLTVTLGEIVAAAHQRSGLTVDAWNELAEDERDKLLNREIEITKAVTASANALVSTPPLENVTIAQFADPTRFEALQQEIMENLTQGFRCLQSVRYRGRTYEPGERLPTNLELDVAAYLTEIGAI